MKKTTKFGALLFGLILAVGSLVGCGGNNTTTSTQSSLTPEEKTAIVEGAGSYVWSTYFTTKPTVKTGSFDVVKRTRYNGVEVQVSWALEITSGSNENGGIEYRTSNDVNFDTVYVGYYDGKVIEDMEYKLTPTFTLDDVTLRMDQIVEPEKAFFSYETPAFVLSGREAWDLNDKSTLNIKGVVLDVIGEGSSSAGSFYMQDSEGYGYYMYKPDPKTEKPVAGNVIAATGKRSDYSGQQEFGAGGTVHIYTGETQQIIVHDATEDFQAAASNKDFDPKYQNNYVTLHGCIPQYHEKKLNDKGEDTNTYYYFTVGTGKAKYNIYDSYYFLSDEQREAFRTAWDEAVANASTIDITGISTVYSGAIQIYGSTNYPQIFEVTGQMTDENKVDATLDEVKGVLAETYSAAAEVELPTHGTLFPTVALTWEVVAPEDETKVKIEENTLKILDIDGSFDEIKVKATATLGEASKDIVLESRTKLEITTIAEFLENKDAENVQYLKGFVVAANGSHTKADSFVLYDGTAAIFSYNKFPVEFGDEIVVSAKYSENGNDKFPQLGTLSVVKTLSEGNTVKGELDYEFTDISTWQAEYEADTSENHTAFTAKYANAFIKFTGVLVKSGNYYNLYSDAEKTTQYAQTNFGTIDPSEFAGQEVDVYGFVRTARGTYPTLQVQAVVAKGTDYFGDSVTVSKTIAEMKEALGWEDTQRYVSWNLDENITISATATDNNTGKYYASNNSWRLYKSGSAQITITAASGYTIKSVTITFGGTNVIDSITSGEAITVNATSWTSEAMASTNSSNRADVTSITVVYEAL